MTITSESLKVEEIAIGDIVPDPANPKNRLPSSEMVASVKKFGVLEPILVHRNGTGKADLIAGHRRWRAAKIAGLKTIPAVVRSSMTDRARIEAQIVENLHREDLDPVSEAEQLVRLVDLDVSVKELSVVVGKSQSHVKDRLRLLMLPDYEKNVLRSGNMSIANALAMCTLVEDNTEEAMTFLEEQCRGLAHPERMIENWFAGRAREKLVTEATAKLEKAGVTVISSGDHRVSAIETIKNSGDDGTMPTLPAHKKLPCIRAKIYAPFGTKKATVEYCCVDPKSHGYGATYVQPSGGNASDKVKEEAKKFRAKKKTRKLEGHPFLMGDMSAKEATEAALQTFVHKTNKWDQACDLIGAKEVYTKQQVDALTGPKLAKFALAVSICLGEEEVSQHWTGVAGERLLSLLKKRGWKAGK